MCKFLLNKQVCKIHFLSKLSNEQYAALTCLASMLGTSRAETIRFALDYLYVNHEAFVVDYKARCKQVLKLKELSK